MKEQVGSMRSMALNASEQCFGSTWRALWILQIITHCISASAKPRHDLPPTRVCQHTRYVLEPDGPRLTTLARIQSWLGCSPSSSYYSLFRSIKTTWKKEEEHVSKMKLLQCLALFDSGLPTKQFQDPSHQATNHAWKLWHHMLPPIALNMVPKRTKKGCLSFKGPGNPKHPSPKKAAPTTSCQSHSI